MKTVWRVFRYLKRYPALAAGTFGCAVLGTLMVIVFPAVAKQVIDEVVRAHHPEKLMPLILYATVAFVLQHALNALRLFLNNTFEQKVIFDLRSDLYSHIQLLPLRWFDNRATGDLMTRVIEDVNSVERVLIDGIEQGVVAVLQVFIVMAVILIETASANMQSIARQLRNQYPDSNRDFGSANLVPLRDVIVGDVRPHTAGIAEWRRTPVVDRLR